MKALITGIEGFVGPHLENFLKSQNFETFGTFLYGSSVMPKNYLPMDVLKYDQIIRVLKIIHPDIIIHLAGFSSVGKSFQFPDKCISINVEGSKNLLKAVYEANLSSKILIVSSGEVYGNTNQIPAIESMPTKVTSPYTESRILQEKNCLLFAEEKSLPLFISRSFNHTGPGQTDDFVISSFAKQIITKLQLANPTIEVGNINIIRDFLDVRDVVQAYLQIILQGKNLEIYNVCSGKGYSLREILNELICLSHYSFDIKIGRAHV
jgi:GDP-4-dehydro-6-deoxy-D-mannose reductase